MNLQCIIDYIRGTALTLVLVILPLIQIFTTRAAPAVIGVSILFCIVAVILSKQSADLFYTQKISISISTTILFLVVFIFIWALLSLLWGIDPARGSQRILFVAITLWVTYFLAKQFLQLPILRVQIVFLIGIFTAVFALFVGLTFVTDINSFQDHQNHRHDYNRLAVGLSFLVWPLIFLLGKNSTLTAISVLVFVGVVIGVFSSESETAKLGIILGSLAAMASQFHYIFQRIIYAFSAALVLAMPFLIPLIERVQAYIFPTSFLEAGHAYHRLQIWKGAADISIEKLWFGWGMKSDKVLSTSGAMGVYTERAGFSSANWGVHNLALELWINLGLVGMIFLAALIFSLGMKTYGTKRHVIAYVGLQISTLTMFLAGAGAGGFQGWLLAIISISAAMCITLGAQRNTFPQL